MQPTVRSVIIVCVAVGSTVESNTREVEHDLQFHSTLHWSTIASVIVLVVATELESVAVTTIETSVLRVVVEDLVTLSCPVSIAQKFARELAPPVVANEYVAVIPVPSGQFTVSELVNPTCVLV